MASERLGILQVKVLPTGDQFRWAVRDDRGKVIESGTDSYATEKAAFHAGSAAARAIRKGLEEKARSANRAKVQPTSAKNEAAN
jgi:hypothetical protein